MNRITVCVATGRYGTGALRLAARMRELNERFIPWYQEPMHSPPHSRVPYAFKARALEIVASEGADTILWADACIYPLQSLTRIWERAEQHGAWIGRNGWKNIQWTAVDAYPDLNITRAENEGIEHVVATAFAVCLRHPVGREIFNEYVNLGLHTRAFVGPWKNGPGDPVSNAHVPRVGPCGPPEVLGHRHDQTALSVIAWRAGVPLTESPDYFAYGKVGDAGIDPRTVLLADGSY
jgi:hypothetical protein